MLLFGKKTRQHYRSFAPLGAALGVIFLVELAVNSGQFLLFVPALVNGALLAAFGYTLFFPPTIAEAVARLRVPELDPEQASYCRSVTVVWSCFFLFNMLLAFYTAFYTSVEFWAVYNGAAVYFLIALLFLAEATYRYWRFRVYAGDPLDRIFIKIFPPRGDM